MPDMIQMPLFEEYAMDTIDKATSVYKGRGLEYGDSWKTNPFLILRSVLKEIPACREFSQAECRAIAAAVQCDTKYARFEGGYKEDNILDGINYMAFLARAVKELNSPGDMPSEEIRNIYWGTPKGENHEKI